MKTTMWFIVIIATVLSIVGIIVFYSKWNKTDKDIYSVGLIISMFLFGGCWVAIAYLTGVIPRGVLI